MPKLKKTETELQNIAYRATLAKHMEEMEYAWQQLAEWMGICATTFFKRNRQPETLTLKELRIFCKKMRVTDRELCEIVGVTYRGKEGA